MFWSYLLTFIGLTGFYLVGKKVWWAWYVNIGNQVLWASYAIITKQYGFLLAAFFYTILFSINAWKWTKGNRQAKIWEAETEAEFEQQRQVYKNKSTFTSIKTFKDLPCGDGRKAPIK